jgi:hypothetical protein
MVARVFRVVALFVAAALPAFAQTDTNPPVVTYTGNQGSYELHENVVIFCNAFDAESGVASTTCQDVNTVAYLLPVGLNTLMAEATDNAGNVGTGSTSFTVLVTYNGVKALTNQFVTKESSARNLSRKLDNAAEAEAAGDLARKERLINSYITQVNRETERNITAPDAALLIQFAQQL